MSSIMIASVVLAFLNLLLAAALGWVYMRNLREVRSPFTLGLALFALFLVVHNAVTAYHFLAMMTMFTAVGEGLVLLESVLQTVALAALVYATMR